MKVCFINPPFKAEYGKFSRESEAPLSVIAVCCITRFG